MTGTPYWIQWALWILGIVFLFLLGRYFLKRYVECGGVAASVLAAAALVITLVRENVLAWIHVPWFPYWHQSSFLRSGGPYYESPLWRFDAFALQFGMANWESILRTLLEFAIFVGAIGFVGRLYRKWVEGRLTESEKAPGMEGVRVWLRLENLLCGLAASLAIASLGIPMGLVSIFALPILALIAYPMLNTFFQVSRASQQAPLPRTEEAEDLSEERVRVLKMLEEGKINAEECTELLNALGQSRVPPVLESSPIDAHSRKLITLGLMLLLVGFFFPWIEGATGSELGGGIGWLILACGIAGAVIPNALHLNVSTRKSFSIAAFGGGALLLLVVILKAPFALGVGIILAGIGFALEMLGTYRAHVYKM